MSREELVVLVVEQAALIADLRVEVAELRARLSANSRNSSRPSSSDGLASSKLILAALAATALFALAVGNASANRLSVTEKNFEVIWNLNQTGKTDLSLIDSGSPAHTTTCKITLLGSFTANTIVKSGKIGQITHGTVGTCSAGSATILQETLPWPINYVSFGGSLPK